jgi:hypothetical protein
MNGVCEYELKGIKKRNKHANANNCGLDFMTDVLWIDLMIYKLLD